MKLDGEIDFPAVKPKFQRMFPARPTYVVGNFIGVLHGELRGARVRPEGESQFVDADVRELIEARKLLFGTGMESLKRLNPNRSSLVSDGVKVWYSEIVAKYRFVSRISKNCAGKPWWST